MTSEGDFLVTVGIPTFNRPEGLRTTLEAICSQTYKNLEILVSDNCSTDPEVGKVLAEFSVSDPRVRIYRHDSGIAAVFNFFYLLDRASGKYFMWAADDDWWHPDFVEVCVNLLTKSPGASVAVARFQPLPDPSGKKRLIPPGFDKIREIQHPDLVTRLKRYIGQKESFGKAHITYGLFPLDDIRESVETLRKLVDDVMPSRTSPRWT